MREMVAVAVMPCSEGPAYVPSRVVVCEHCGADCWLSEKTGDSTIAAAAAMGRAVITCTPCVLRIATARAGLSLCSISAGLSLGESVPIAGTGIIGKRIRSANVLRNAVDRSTAHAE